MLQASLEVQGHHKCFGGISGMLEDGGISTGLAVSLAGFLGIQVFLIICRYLWCVGGITGLLGISQRCLRYPRWVVAGISEGLEVVSPLVCNLTIHFIPFFRWTHHHGGRADLSAPGQSGSQRPVHWAEAQLRGEDDERTAGAEGPLTGV